MISFQHRRQNSWSSISLCSNDLEFTGSTGLLQQTHNNDWEEEEEDICSLSLSGTGIIMMLKKLNKQTSPTRQEDRDQMKGFRAWRRV
jgi:hypothetical protein